MANAVKHDNRMTHSKRVEPDRLVQHLAENVPATCNYFSEPTIHSPKPPSAV